MTKIVNNLSAKMEIGSPMACMYLLCNPDHYTSHSFAPFYWQNYIHEARVAWDPDNVISGGHVEKVALIKRKGCIIGLSPVYDYIYRPQELEHMCLYDWVGRYVREKLPEQKNISNIDNIVSYNDERSESDTCELPSVKNLPQTGIHNIDVTTGDACKSDIVEEQSNKETGLFPTGLFNFTDGHPLYTSHGTCCVQKSSAKVPTFIGAILPHCDQGDREYYCSTMLALFKPWRSGLELKAQDQSWDESFLSYKFNQRQRELMENFNIKYECLDAQDDFHAQLRKGSVILPSWGDKYNPIMDHTDLDQLDVDYQGAAINCSVEFDADFKEIGKREKKRQLDMTTMQTVVVQTGWTEVVMAESNTQPSPPAFLQSGNQWKAAVQRKRQDILDIRAENLPSCANNTANSSHNNTVRIIDQTYLEKTHHSTQTKLVLDEIVSEFQLNQDQKRAFDIVSNHNLAINSEQLKMYIDGMGGTGKTQVLKALVQFFKKRNEAHRLVIVAPTGTAAALLAGSTYHVWIE